MYNKGIKINIRRTEMTDTTNHTRTVDETRTIMGIYNQFLSGRSTDDIASNLNALRLRVGHVHSATGDQAALNQQQQVSEVNCNAEINTMF